MIRKRLVGRSISGHAGGTIGSDRLEQYMSRTYDDRIRREDELEAAMDRLIEQAHCRLLQRATGGRLTWQGDQIVRVANGAGRYKTGAAYDGSVQAMHTMATRTTSASHASPSLPPEAASDDRQASPQTAGALQSVPRE